jgi:hypothetical protein
MLEGKNVKLTFHAVVANCYGNLVVNSLILDAATCLAIRINVYVEIPPNHHP